MSINIIFFSSGEKEESSRLLFKIQHQASDEVLELLKLKLAEKSKDFQHFLKPNNFNDIRNEFIPGKP
jgi:hypothetical protein